ncbi:hypothetical protein N7540_009622 [Penicillium herquei]|nr:hypothetical protein N7540_009622 [Penicillium herquei]
MITPPKQSFFLSACSACLAVLQPRPWLCIAIGIPHQSDIAKPRYFKLTVRDEAVPGMAGSDYYGVSAWHFPPEFTVQITHDQDDGDNGDRSNAIVAAKAPPKPCLPSSLITAPADWLY